MTMTKKEQQKANARNAYMSGRYQQKDIAALVGVSTNTISKWATEGKWKESRAASFMSDDKINENGKQALANLGEMLLDQQKKREELIQAAEPDHLAIAAVDSAILKITDGMAKLKKSYESIDKNNAVSYATYMQVMSSVFSALRDYDLKLFMQTIDFQSTHSQEMAIKMG